MKKGIHPESYRLVAFKDMSNEQVFITRSCVNSKETIEICKAGDFKHVTSFLYR